MIGTLAFPDAAPLNFQNGQVRHFSREDGFGAEALQRPTRMLAARDNMLRDKLNEVVDRVNNKEQYVSVPIVCTMLPAGSTEIVSNFNIPSGFQVRVFNARVATSLNNNTGVLRVVFSPGTFGSTGGSGDTIAAVTSAADPALDTEFRAGGELVVSIENHGTARARLAASLILILRPIGDIDAALIESSVGLGIRGEQGIPGPAGPVGPAGPSGVTAYGFRWRGPWRSTPLTASADDPHAGELYTATGQTKDVVSSTVGGNVSSWVCITGGAAATSNPPPTTADGVSTAWKPLASSWTALAGTPGTPGAAGAVGPAGLVFRGPWNSGTAYAERNVVTTDTAGLRRTWYCNSTNTGVDPAAGANAAWTELFGSSVGPSYESRASTVSVMGVTGLAFGLAAGEYAGSDAPNPGMATALAGATTVVNLPGSEFSIMGGQAGAGAAFFRFSFRAVLKGTIKIKMPQTDGSVASIRNWLATDAAINVIPHGVDTGSTPYEITVLRINFDGTGPALNAYQVTVGAADPVKVDISLIGMAQVA